MRILVVEDDRRMAELLRQGLSEEGHSVTIAVDGRAGLSLAESDPFELLILDVMLPGIDGFSIARRLRSERNQTPILMLTARDTTKDIVEGLNLGADDYLTKPFSFEELFARVRSAGRRGDRASAGRGSPAIRVHRPTSERRAVLPSHSRKRRRRAPVLGNDSQRTERRARAVTR